MKQKEKTQVVKVRIEIDIIYDPVGLEVITEQSICARVFNNYNTAIPCRHKLPKLIPYQHMTLHPVYKILNPILKSLPQIIAM